MSAKVSRLIDRRAALGVALAAGACTVGGRRLATSSLDERLSGDIAPVHDPCIIRQGDTYHLFCTGHLGRGAGVLPWRTSPDLVHWSDNGSVFDALPDWAEREVPGTSGIWAPDISHRDGRYHLYYALSTFGKNRSAIGLASTPTLDRRDPQFGWRDDGVVIRSQPGDDYNAIDPNLAVDTDGRPWLAFGSFWSGIKLVALDPAICKPAPDADLTSLVRRPTTPDAVEAPFIIRRGGYFYLFAAFDFCCRGADSSYYTVVGRSDRIDGPYRDSAGRAMLEGGGTIVLRASPGQRFAGPGHPAILHDGDRFLIVYHAYDTQAHGTPTLRIQPLGWTSDGWPVAQ